jgi:hypothetical protein
MVIRIRYLATSGRVRFFVVLRGESHFPYCHHREHRHAVRSASARNSVSISSPTPNFGSPSSSVLSSCVGKSGSRRLAPAVNSQITPPRFAPPCTEDDGDLPYPMARFEHGHENGSGCVLPRILWWPRSVVPQRL